MPTEEKIVVSEQDFRKRFTYDSSSCLGEGGFAKVYKAHDRQFDETVALKFYTKTNVQKYDIITEMRNSRRFTHQNIIRVHDARIVRFTDRYGATEDVQVGILEYANGGDLLDFLASDHSEAAFKQVMIGILRGLHYLHTEKRVIHRDLSPDNILMIREDDIWIPKIADFGISKQVDLQTVNLGDRKVSEELIGKMEYMAPEQFDPQKYGIDGRMATNVDLWAFGVILAEVFIESSPFGSREASQNPMQIVHNVLNNPPPEQINSVPEPYRRVIRQCLIKDARQRPQSSQELIDWLSAPPPPVSPPRAAFSGATSPSPRAARPEDDLSEAAPSWRTYPDRHKKNRQRVVVGAVVMLLALGGIAYYLSQQPERKNIVLTPSPRSTPERTTMSSAPATSPTDDSVTTAAAALPEDEEAPAATVLPSDRLPTEEKRTPPPKATAPPAAVLFPKLLREIDALDNEIINADLRMSRIDRHIQTYFVDKNVPVRVSADGAVEEQNVADFFTYVVNTAEMESRDWRIDTTRTMVNEGKIAELYVEKY